MQFFKGWFFFRRQFDVRGFNDISLCPLNEVGYQTLCQIDSAMQNHESLVGLRGKKTKSHREQGRKEVIYLLGLNFVPICLK